MIYELDNPLIPDHNTLPASINMEFNADEDVDILESTKDFGYWWNFTGSEVEAPRVTRHIIHSHFHAYFHAVSLCPYFWFSNTPMTFSDDSQNEGNDA
jgi:hypothetical protein